MTTQTLKNAQDEVFFTITYRKDQDLFYANWIGADLSLAQVQEGALLFLSLIKEKEQSKLLNDNRQLIGVWDEANDWLANEWMPQVIQAGLSKFAHIYSKDFYANLSAEFLEDNAKKIGGFEIKLFDDEQKAVDWLMAD